MIDYEDFLKVEMHVGKIIRVSLFPEARKPAYKLTIDFGGSIGIKNSSAQITDRYQPDDLQDRLIIAVTNFPPKQIANFISEVLLLGVADANSHVSLLSVASDTPIGHRVY